MCVVSQPLGHPGLPVRFELGRVKLILSLGDWRSQPNKSLIETRKTHLTSWEEENP